MGDYEKSAEQEPEPQPRPEQEVAGGPEPAPEPEAAAGQALGDALKVSFRFLKWAMILLVVLYLLEGIFWVDLQEIKFKLRFGEIVRVKGHQVLKAETGIYIRWPWEEVVELRTDEQALELTDEFWPQAPELRVSGTAGLDVRNDGYLLTGDANIVHVKLRARYRIRNDADGALAYKLQVADPELILRRALMASTVKVVGSMPVMGVIKREALFSGIEADLHRRLARFEKDAGCPLGLDLIRVEAIEKENVKNPTEPTAVSQAFYQAQTAESLKDQLRREGDVEASKILSAAAAEATRIRAEAGAEAVRLVRSTRADAEAMAQILPIYRISPQVARILREMYYERAMQQVLLNAPGVHVLYEPRDGDAREIRMMLERKPIPKSIPAGGQ